MEGAPLQVQGAIGETVHPPGTPRHSRGNVIADPRLSSAERHRDLDIASRRHHAVPSPLPTNSPTRDHKLDHISFLASPSTISTTTSDNAPSTRLGYRHSRGLDSHLGPDREQQDRYRPYTHSSYDPPPIPASAKLALHIGPAQLASHCCTSRYGARHTAYRHRYNKQGHHMPL